MVDIKKAFKETAYYRTIEATSPDERLLVVVKQHPFGIMTIYILAILAFTASISIISMFLDSVFSTSTVVYAIWAFLALIAALFLLIVLLGVTYIYNQSRLTVTDKNIVQVLQKTLVQRKVSHLSLANVEDVTTDQKGLFAGTFNFGTIRIETAGEQANFNFPMCPQPNRVARIILDAKDEFLQMTGQAGSYRNNPPRFQGSRTEPTHTSNLQNTQPKDYEKSSQLLGQQANKFGGTDATSH